MKKLLLLLALLSAAALHAQKDSPWRKLQMAEFAIANLYVDSVDESKLVEEAIIHMLATLDPHSLYSNPEEVRQLNEPLQGNFEGIGIQYNMLQDTLFVIQTIAGGPSEKAGILPGDRIVMANDTAIAGAKMTTEEIMRRLRGPKGSKVDLKVRRPGSKELLSFTVKRDRIPIHSIDAAYLIQEGTGYIRLNRFASTTSKEFAQALSQLRKEGMESLILDLRGNGGGYLNTAIDIANEFLDSRQLIVYTEGRESPKKEFHAKGNGKFRKGRVAVLIDEYSASASEIVAGALQDWDRAVIVGRRSFGKGLVQRPVNLPDGSMIRLTVARYYTPAGRCIQKPYTDAKDYNKELMNRFRHGELSHADSIHLADSLRYATLQLHRTVYGSGGIMPDCFVPLDTTFFTPYYRQLRDKGVLLQTYVEQLEQHREEWQNEYPDIRSYTSSFEVPPAMLRRLVQKGEENGIPFHEEEYAQSLPFIQEQLKALIARDLWDMEAYFQVINQTDASIAKALELLGQEDSPFPTR